MLVLCYVVLLMWVLSFGRTLLNLALIPRLEVRDDDDAPRPFVSIIIPARDEAHVIERTVRAFLAQRYEPFEVVVVDDRSTDETGAILRGIAATDPRLVVVHGEEPPPGWLGKPAALYRGAAHARGEILLFVDADLVYAPDALRGAVDRLSRSGAGMITLLPHFEMDTLGERITMPMLAVTVFSFLPTWLSNRTRIVKLAVGGGTGNMIRREVYEAIGGHQALRDSVVDDVALARLVRRNGFRTVAVRADDFISLHMYHGLREVIDGFTKNSFAVMGRSMIATVLSAVGAMIFHVLPYALCLVPRYRIVSLATVAVITLTRVVLFRTLRYGTLNALLFHPVMVLLWTWIFLRSAWITGVRGELRWRGRTYDAAATKFGAER